MEIKDMEGVTRYHILEDFRKGYLKPQEAADILGITRQHIYWLKKKKKIEKMGIKGLVHGSKGKPSARR